MDGKKRMILFSVLCLLLLSCDNRIDPIVIRPNNNTKPNVTDEKIPVPFDFRGVDSRPHLTKDSYTEEQAKAMEKAFADSMSKAKTLRGKAVKAGLFVTAMDYCIPYSFPIWLNTKPELNPEYKYCGIYMRQGLFLRPLKENGRTYDPWGWPYPVTENVRKAWPNTAFPDPTFPNGFTCSQYVDWCLFNAGVTQYGNEPLYGKWATDLRVYPGSKEVSLKAGSKSARPGDLIGFPGHIALILGVVGDYVIYGSTDGGGDASWSGSGVRWHAYNVKTTDYDTYQYKFIIQMAGVYKD